MSPFVRRGDIINWLKEWREYNSLLCFYLYIVLNKNWKYLVVWTIKQRFTGLGLEDRCSSYSWVPPFSLYWYNFTRSDLLTLKSSDSNIVNDICYVPSHFQKSPVRNYFDFIDNFNTIFPHHSHQILLSHKMLTGKFTYYTMFIKKPSHIDIAIIPRRYFFIKLHTWFCLSYFLKTSIKFYSIYQYFMSIIIFFNTLSVSVSPN
jgi:hypothetical protein